jgi:hypothetical protein
MSIYVAGVSLCGSPQPDGALHDVLNELDKAALVARFECNPDNPSTSAMPGRTKHGQSQEADSILDAQSTIG